MIWQQVGGVSLPSAVHRDNSWSPRGGGAALNPDKTLSQSRENGDRSPTLLPGRASAWQGELVTQTPHPEAEKAHRKHLTRFRRKQRPQIRHGKSWFIVLSIGLDLRWDHSDSLVLKLINIACDVGSTRRDRWVLGCCIPSTEGWMIYSRRWSNCDLGETPH